MSMYKKLHVFEFDTKIIESKVCIQNSHMRMYKYVARMVFLCAILASGTDWFGDPIECMAEHPVPKAMFTSFCYMEDSLTYDIKSPDDEYSRVTKPSYYQWVWLLLALQAFLTVLPGLTWKHLEGRKLVRLLKKSDSDFQNPSSIGKFISSNQDWYSSQASYFLICHLFCLLASIMQVFIMNAFLGIDVVTSITNWPPLIFPRVVKCNMPYIGPAGSIREYSGICTLSYSALHEKIYMVVITSYLTLVVVSMIHTILQLLLLIYPALRLYLLKLKTNNLLSDRLLGTKIKFCSYGDFVLFMLISRNTDPVGFSEIVKAWVNSRSESEEVNDRFTDSENGVVNKKSKERTS